MSGEPGPCGCGCALTPATSLGFGAVEFARDVLGVEPFPWQRFLLIHAGELVPGTRRFRFRTVIVLVGRQSGKTSLLQFKALWKLYVLRIALVVNTAQDLSIAEESWDAGVDMVEQIPELAAELDHVDRTNGKKALRLTGRRRWRIAATNRRAGRGLSADDVNLDELREHLNWQAWGAVTKTTLARPRAQVFGFSNAGDDSSVVLNSLQEKGRAAAVHADAADPQFGYFEWSAPDDCDYRDERFWPMSCPSLGYKGGVTLDALRSACGTDPEPVFRTEVLCQRVASRQPAVIPPTSWRDRSGAQGRPDRAIAFAVTASWPDAAWGCVSVAGARGGEWMVQVAARRRGTAWIPEYLAERVERHKPVAVVIHAGGPAGPLIPDLEAEGIELVKVTERQVGHAAARFRAAMRGEPEPTQGDDAELVDLDVLGPDDLGEADVDADAPPAGVRMVRHFGQQVLTRAVQSAQTQPLGSRGWTWAVRDASVDIAPLDGVSLALWGATVHEVDDYDLTESVW